MGLGAVQAAMQGKKQRTGTDVNTGKPTNDPYTKFTEKWSRSGNTRSKLKEGSDYTDGSYSRTKSKTKSTKKKIVSKSKGYSVDGVTGKVVKGRSSSVQRLNKATNG